MQLTKKKDWKYFIQIYCLHFTWFHVFMLFTLRESSNMRWILIHLFFKQCKIIYILNILLKIIFLFMHIHIQYIYNIWIDYIIKAHDLFVHRTDDNGVCLSCRTRHSHNIFPRCVSVVLKMMWKTKWMF